jgi:hypothetical protein
VPILRFLYSIILTFLHRFQKWKVCTPITWLLSINSIIYKNAFTWFRSRPTCFARTALQGRRYFNLRSHLKVKDNFLGLWPDLHSEPTSVFTFIRAELSQFHETVCRQFSRTKNGEVSSPQWG